jgi:hypothetical protein
MQWPSRVLAVTDALAFTYSTYHTLQTANMNPANLCFSQNTRQTCVRNRSVRAQSCAR